MQKTKGKANKGITLIALVITIIVLIILAGISISLVLGKNGLLSRAKQARESYDEAQAREKLEVILLELQGDKVSDSKYNENDYIDRKLTQNGMIVMQNIVSIDGWQFELDRSIPKIKTNLGKAVLEEKIQIDVTSKLSSDHLKSTLTIEITYEDEIAGILFDGENVTVPEKVNGKYTITKEILFNGSYNIIVKDIENKYNMKTFEVTGIKGNIEIWNLEDLIAFRDEVNSGETFAGRQVRVMADIDVEGLEENQWTPIGDYGTNTSHKFRGTFDGQNYTIHNIYINSTGNYIGLFGYIDTNGEIKNLNLDGTVYGKEDVGILTGYNRGTIENVKVTGNMYINQESANYIGGIVGWNVGKIQKCYSNVKISDNGINTNAQNIGGLVGLNRANIEQSASNAKIEMSNASGQAYRRINRRNEWRKYNRCLFKRRNKWK